MFNSVSPRSILRVMFVLLMGMGSIAAGVLGKMCGFLCFVPEAERNLLMAAVVAITMAPLVCIYCVILIDNRLDTTHNRLQLTPPQAA